MTDLKVQYLPIDSLTPHEGNPRTHNRHQRRKMTESIRRFGFTNPVLIDDKGSILAGHCRVEAAKLLGMRQVPTIRLDHMTAAEKRAYIIADNRLAELAGWDKDLLALEFKALAALDLDFDLEITGFETAEIDLLIQGDDTTTGPDPADGLPDLHSGPPASAPGDLWILGPHRLLCGNALDASSYTALMVGTRAQAVFTDPPYNVPIDGHVCGSGKTKHAEFAMAAGELSEVEFTGFLTRAFEHAVRWSADGALHYICMDWRHLPEILEAGHQVYAEFKALCVWNKTNGGMGSLYRSKHELVFVFKQGTAPHINNIELGRHGRYRTNVWDYAGVNSFGGNREDLALHPTVKPIAMVADAILDCTRRGQIVLDPFMGSGTTLLAAERTGRIAHGLELDPRYVDLIIRRWQDMTGGDAIHAVTGQTFTERAALQPVQPDVNVPARPDPDHAVPEPVGSGGPARGEG